MNVRHINRGDIKEGGCPLCKPRHKRYGGWVNGKVQHPQVFVDEALEELDEDCD